MKISTSAGFLPGEKLKKRQDIAALKGLPAIVVGKAEYHHSQCEEQTLAVFQRGDDASSFQHVVNDLRYNEGDTREVLLSW